MNPEKIPTIVARVIVCALLPLFLASLLCSQPVTWTGSAGDGSWHGVNWKTVSDAGTSFTQGDIVNLDGSNGANDTIDVGTLTSATVAGMYVSGNHSYLITGAGIIADPNAGDFPGFAASSGKLILGARAAGDASISAALFTGTLDLTGQDAGAANDFAGGVEITSGALRISSTGQLGTTLGNLRVTGTGALLVAGNMAFDGAGAGAHRLALDSGVSGTIALEAGVSLAFVNSSAGGANGGVFSLNSGARLDLVAGGGASFLFDGNTGVTGGAIYGADAVIFLDSGSFNNNRSTNVGGAINVISGTISVRNSAFTNNSSGASNNGGAIANQGGTLGATNVLFASNTAGPTSGGMGGGIFNNTGATATVTSATFRGNYASNAGGALAAQNPSTVYVTDALFASNTANNQGGAIFLAANSVVSVTNARFQDNTAASNTSGGGAISNNGGTLSVANALFQSNTAGAGMGGAISNNQTTANTTIQSATFSGNHAFANGGAIGAGSNSIVITLSDALLTANSSGANGGAVSAAGNAINTTVANVAFTGNRAAQNGGAFYSSGNANTVTGMTNVLFSSNTALSGNGGAVNLENNNSITLTSGTFINNLASGSGGAINHAGGANAKITLTNVSFIDNTASAGVGGAISMAGGTLAYNVTTGTSLIAGNTAAANSNGINLSASTSGSFNVASGAALDMLDAMTGSVANGQTISITKAGSGIWRIGGLNTFTQAGSGKTSFTVNSGTLQLYRAGQTSASHAVAAAGSLNLAGASSSFTLANGATLLASGGNTITTGSIFLGASSIISLDLAGANTSTTLLTLNSTSAATLIANDWTQTLALLNISDLTSTAQSGDIFKLITLGADSGLFTSANLATLTGNATGLTSDYTLQLSTDSKTLQLYYYFTRTLNEVLTWTGTLGASWSGSNWKSTSLASNSFLQGDIINLASTPAPGVTAINIDTTTSATIAGMYVSGSQNHTITGTSIIAAAAASTLTGTTAATGKLVLGALASNDATSIDTASPAAIYTGTLTLANTSNNFTGGIDILTGHLVGNADTLGAGVAGITIAATGALTFDQADDATYAGPIHGAGLLTKANNGTLTLTAANSAFTGTANINAGAIALAGASLGGQLNLASGANLSGSGSLGNVTALGSNTITIGLTHSGTPVVTATLAISGTLNLAPDTTLRYDLAPGNQSDLITAAHLVRTGTATIDINSSLSGTYTLITAANLATSDTDSLITTSNGGTLAERAQAGYTTNGNNLNLVIITANLANVKWSGTNTAFWQDNQANWQTEDGEFLDGDSVIFDDTATGARSVTIGATGVCAVDMLVDTTGTYTFTGGAITTSNTINSTIAPAGTGALTIDGPGLVILGNTANNFQGGITIAGGTLQGNAATLVTGGSIANNGALIFDQATNATYATAITGNGSLAKLNTGTLTLNNAANTYAGGVNVFAGTLELQNSGPSTKSAITIASAAQLRITSDTAYAIAHDITGNGLLSIDTAGNAVTATIATSSAFTGTISLGASTFTLDTAAASLVRNASLHLGAGNATTVATGTQQTAGLALDGALLKFSATTPSDLAAAGIINTATLALNSGTIQVTIPSAPAAASTGANLLAQDDGTAITRLITADTVTGNAGNLTLVDQNNNPVANATAQSINISQNAATVATGTYNYGLTAANGLAVSYKLVSLTIAEGQTLSLASDTGATGAAATFTATISGNGNLSIDATNASVTLSAANNYTGATTVTGGTLISGAANALGADPANTLILDDTAAFNLNRNTQTLAAVTTASTSILNLNAGVLTLQSGGAINGALTGSGTLNITGGNLDIAGANTTTVTTNIAASATATLGDTAALGTAAINLQDTTATLNVAPVVNGTFANPVTGSGVLNIAGSGTTTIARGNNSFTGRVTVTGNLLAAHINALGGTAAVTVNETGNLTYTASGNLPLSIAGTGTLNLANTTGTLTLTGNTTIAAINAMAGANIRANANSLGTPATRLAISDATITLAQNNTTLGAVAMSGASRLAFANIATGNATLASLASTGSGATLAFNTNIATGTSNTLVVTGAITGTYTIVITNTGFPPGSGPATLTLVQGGSNNATYLGSGTLTFGYNPISYAYNIATTTGGASLTVERAGFGPTGAAIAATSGAMPLTWLAELDSIEKRLGDLRLAPRSGLGKDLWMRVNTQRLDVDDTDTLAPFREDQYGAEAGIDYGGSGGKSGLTACIGAFVGYGSSSRSISGMRASGDTTSAHGGAYAICMTPSGWYVDIVGKYNSFKNKISATSDDSPMNARYNTTALGASVEAGKRIALGAAWHITPNAQFAAARLNGVQYNAATNTGNLAVNLGAVSTGQIRAGTLLGYQRAMKNGRMIQPYAKFHLAQQWTNGGTMTVDDVSYGTPKIQGTRADAGLGVNWMVAKSIQVYFDYEYAWAKDYRKPYGLTAGVTCAW